MGTELEVDVDTKMKVNMDPVIQEWQLGTLPSSNPDWLTGHTWFPLTIKHESPITAFKEILLCIRKQLEIICRF